MHELTEGQRRNSNHGDAGNGGSTRRASSISSMVAGSFSSRSRLHSTSDKEVDDGSRIFGLVVEGNLIKLESYVAMLTQSGDLKAEDIVSKRNEHMQTAIHLVNQVKAVYDDKKKGYISLEIAKYLIDNGAKLDTIDQEGNNPLHSIVASYEAYRGSDKMKKLKGTVALFDLLLSFSCDYTVENKSKQQPMQILCSVASTDEIFSVTTRAKFNYFDGVFQEYIASGEKNKVKDHSSLTSSGSSGLSKSPSSSSSDGGEGNNNNKRVNNTGKVRRSSSANENNCCIS